MDRYWAYPLRSVAKPAQRLFIDLQALRCDYHPGFQQIAWVDSETGEPRERRLAHREEAEQFYHQLKEQSLPVRVGMEASGHSRWLHPPSGYRPMLIRDLIRN